MVRDDEPASRFLRGLRDKVRSGDPDNIEAQASKRFWAAYLPEFRRETEGGMPPNNLLNYGYMVMRAAVARALCSAGLLPTFGIHHRNKYNAFCLADDVLEPFEDLWKKRCGLWYARLDIRGPWGLNAAAKGTTAGGAL